MKTINNTVSASLAVAFLATGLSAATSSLAQDTVACYIARGVCVEAFTHSGLEKRCIKDNQEILPRCPAENRVATCWKYTTACVETWGTCTRVNAYVLSYESNSAAADPRAHCASLHRGPGEETEYREWKQQ